MTIQKAVSAGTLGPGLYLKVNLLAGSGGISAGELRVLQVCPKSAAGTLTADTEIRTGGGEDSAGVAYGTGSQGHLAAKQLYSKFPTAVVDFCAPTAGTGTATTSITITGSPTANVAVGVKVAGREWEVGWLTGETANDLRDRIVTSILQRTTDLPATAAAGTTGVVIINGKVPGKISNDIKVRVWLKATQSGTEAISPSTLTALAGGTTDPDVSTVLALAAGKEYHCILVCMSNADAETAGSTSNAERTLVYIEAHNEGLDAKLQTLSYATTGSQANAITAAQARNVGYAEQVNCLNGQSLPCEFAANEVGDRLYGASLDPAANRIGNRLGGTLYGSEDPIGDNPTQAEKEALLGAGVSPVGYDASGNMVFIRPITCYSQNSAGGPDRRLLDVQNVDGAYIVARDLRSALPTEFPNAKVIKDQAPGSQEIPKGVIEERDIKAFVVTRLRSWVGEGVVIGANLEASIDSGELVVEIDEADATQVNIVIPISIVQPLAKFGLVVNRVPV